SRARDIEALLGPSIRAASYEVGEEVAAHFEPAAVIRRPEWPRPHLDLARAAEIQLLSAGLPPKNIIDSALCTFLSPDAFPSYRRDGQACGRLVAAAGVVSR